MNVIESVGELPVIQVWVETITLHLSSVIIKQQKFESTRAAEAQLLTKLCYQLSRSMVQGGSHSQALPGESEDKLSKVTAGYTLHPVKMCSQCFQVSIWQQQNIQPVHHRVRG